MGLKFETKRGSWASSSFHLFLPFLLAGGAFRKKEEEEKREGGS